MDREKLKRKELFKLEESFCKVRWFNGVSLFPRMAKGASKGAGAEVMAEPATSL